ncbi:22132_t:CDS:1, partial [Gigaspora rosea]
MACCTERDYNAPVVEIRLEHLISNYSKAIVKKKGYTRLVFLYNKVKQEDWENYRKELHKRVVREESIKR